MNVWVGLGTHTSAVGIVANVPGKNGLKSDDSNVSCMVCMKTENIRSKLGANE